MKFYKSQKNKILKITISKSKTVTRIKDNPWIISAIFKNRKDQKILNCYNRRCKYIKLTDSISQNPIDRVEN